MAETVSSLWIGDALGILERLAIASFLRQGHGYHLYCYEAVANVPTEAMIKDANEILPASSIFRYERGPGKGSVAAFANLFRYRLLLEKGGWWVDTDVVCLKPFDFCEAVVFASEHTQSARQVTNAVMKLPAGHAVARLCYESAGRRDKRTLGWAETGPLLLDHVVVANGLTHFVKDVAVFCPIPWWEWALVLGEDSSTCTRFLSASSYAIHLWHEMWRRAGVDGQTRFPAKSLFSQLLENYGLGP